MTTKAAEKTSLHIKRFINAPRARVYAAWRDPAQLKQWFGPEFVQTHDFVADVRVGGEYRWDLTSPEGERMTVRGEYRELVPARKSSSPRKGMTTMFGKIATALLPWSCPIAKVAPNCF